MPNRRGRRGGATARQQGGQQEPQQPQKEAEEEQSPMDTSKEEELAEGTEMEVEEKEEDAGLETSDLNVSQDLDKSKDEEENKDKKASAEEGQAPEDSTKKEAGKVKKVPLLGDPPRIRLTDLPPFEVATMRVRSKWSIRIQAVTPEDAIMSGLMSMPKVMDAYYYLPQRDHDRGQMELCIQNTNDALLAMLRILRNPFIHRVITIQLIKRQAFRMTRDAIAPAAETGGATAPAAEKGDAAGLAKAEETKPDEATPAAVEADATEPKEAEEQKPAEGTADEKTVADSETQAEESMETVADSKAGAEESVEQEGTPAEKEEEEKKGEDGKEKQQNPRGPKHKYKYKYKGRGIFKPFGWNEVKETATIMVNLNRVQRIKFAPKVKGDLSRRCVYVGTLPRSTSEEMLKVIFPMANGITMKPADDPEMRHVFVETCNHFNAVGFMMSYPGVRVNGKELRLSVREKDCSPLKKDELSEEDTKKEGEEKKDGGEKKEGEEIKEGEEKEGGEEDMANEDEETAKKEDNEEEEDAKKQEDKNQGEEDKKDEDNKEKSTFSTEKAKSRKKKRKRTFMDEIQREWSGTKRPRQDSESMGPPQGGQRSSGRGRSKFSRGGFSSFNQEGSGLMQRPVPPVFQIQDKIAGLVRLQNQLELTIHNQMNIIHQSEAAAARQQMQMRMRGQDVGGRFSGFGDRSRDFHRSPSRDGNQGRQQSSENKGGRGKRNRRGKKRSGGRFGGRDSTEDGRGRGQNAGRRDSSGGGVSGFGGRTFTGGKSDRSFGNDRGTRFSGESFSKYSGGSNTGSRFSSGGSSYAGGSSSYGGATSSFDDGFGRSSTSFGSGFRGDDTSFRSGDNFGGSSLSGSTPGTGGSYWGTDSSVARFSSGALGSGSVGGSYNMDSFGASDSSFGSRSNYSSGNLMGSDSGFGTTKSGFSVRDDNLGGSGSYGSMDNWNTSYGSNQSGQSGLSSGNSFSNMQNRYSSGSFKRF